MNPKVSIIVLNWNGYKDTIECLKSLGKITHPNYEVIIVDNGSTDRSERFIKEHFPDIPLLQMGKNLGYARGNNVGIRYALERGSDYIWLLNNDTVVDKDCLQYMVRVAEADDLIGMVGSKIYYLEMPQTIWFAGGEVDLKGGGQTHHIGKDHKDNGSYNNLKLIEYITGCSILAKKDMIEDVGLLDENYFLYFEDADWCLRARRNGWKLVYEPKAKLWHREGARLDENYTPKFVYYSLKARLYFMKRFAPQRMLHCHLLQLRMILFFAKSALRQGISACLKIFQLSLFSYIDFYIFKKKEAKKGL